MKKVWKIMATSFIAIALLFSFSYIPKVIKADSGFDSDSGGDSSSSSDWDSWDDGPGESGSLHGPSTIAEPIGIVLFIAIGVFIVSIPIVINVIERKNLSRKNTENLLAKYESTPLKDETLNDQAFDIYKRVQVAWMNQDLEPVRDIITDEMFNMYEMQLDTLIESKQKNIMDDIRFVDGYLVNKEEQGFKQERITMFMVVTCKDYFVDENNNVVKGSEYAHHEYYYELQFIRSIDESVNNCPSCGGYLDNLHGNKCPHCGNIVFVNDGTMKLSKKTMLKQILK